MPRVAEVVDADVVEHAVLDGHGLPLPGLRLFEEACPVQPSLAGGDDRLADEPALKHAGRAAKADGHAKVADDRVGPEARLNRGAESRLDLRPRLDERRVVLAGHFFEGFESQRRPSRRLGLGDLQRTHRGGHGRNRRWGDDNTRHPPAEVRGLNSRRKFRVRTAASARRAPRSRCPVRRSPGVGPGWASEQPSAWHFRRSPETRGRPEGSGAPRGRMSRWTVGFPQRRLPRSSACSRKAKDCAASLSLSLNRRIFGCAPELGRGPTVIRPGVGEEAGPGLQGTRRQPAPGCFPASR